MIVAFSLGWVFSGYTLGVSCAGYVRSVVSVQIMQVFGLWSNTPVQRGRSS